MEISSTIKFKFLTLLLLALLVVPSVLWACVICEDIPDPEEEKLKEQIQKRGKEMIPELREILACNHKEHQPYKLIAITALAHFQDEKSIPALKKIVLELKNPASLSVFGPMTPAADLRLVSARALKELEVMGVADQLFADWKQLPPKRRRELPSLIGALHEPEILEMLTKIIREGRDRETVFQAVVQMHRFGRRAQTRVVRERMEQWEEEYSRLIQGGGEDLSFPQQIDYTRRTLHLMEGRR